MRFNFNKNSFPADVTYFYTDKNQCSEKEQICFEMSGIYHYFNCETKELAEQVFDDIVESIKENVNIIDIESLFKIRKKIEVEN